MIKKRLTRALVDHSKRHRVKHKQVGSNVVDLDPNSGKYATLNHCGGKASGDDAYYIGFIEGCMSVEGNTREVCDSATDG